MSDIAVRATGLPVHARLQRSRCAWRLELAAVLVSGGASALGAWWALAGGLAAWAAMLLIALAMFVQLYRLSLRDRVCKGVAVDAGGNWAVNTASGWVRFVPDRIWRSPLGWMTLQGKVHALPGAGRSTVPSSTLTFTLWYDSVCATDWRLLRVAANWTTQRGQGLLLRPEAQDPRLGGV